MRVGLYRPDGNAIPGFSLAECRALAGDQLNEAGCGKEFKIMSSGKQRGHKVNFGNLIRFFS